MQGIYLDYAAATPVAEEVLKSMEPYFGGKYGNPGSLHSFGQEAHAAVDRAREIVAGELGTEFREIIFASSATEANNHVIRGAVKSFTAEKPRVVISAIEHESVDETADDLKKAGVDVVKVAVSEGGIVDLQKLEAALNKNTALVSIIYGSNVIGVLQPIQEIARIVRVFRAKSGGVYPLFHTDAVQALQFERLDVSELGVDALTLSGQKIYGPKGAGVLFLKKEWHSRVAPLITGGMQEFGFRAGTENVPAIVGLGRAVKLVRESRKAETKRVKELRDYFWQELQKRVPGVALNGSLKHRLPNNLHVSFPGKDNQELLIKLDQAGIAASIGSACSIRARTASRTVLALGFGEERATNCIRFTLGRPTTKEEVDTALLRMQSLI